jgi:membrane protease subunit HflK
MPWSDNSDPGPKSGGKQGPWGQSPSPGSSRPPENDDARPQGASPKGGSPNGGPPKGGPRRPQSPPQPPEDLATLWRRFRPSLDPVLGPPGRASQPRLISLGLGAAVALWLASGFYVVDPKEQAVVTTFGAWTRTEGPGARYHLPEPIERVEKVQVTSLNQVNIGGGDDAGASLMLTGDQNIVDLDFTVQWRVNDPAKYLFSVKDADDTVKNVAESAIREVVGRTNLQTIMTLGRGAVQDQTRELMQRILDGYQSGVTVVDVQIIAANPPREVIPDFQAVTAAHQYADSAVNEARTYENKVVNEAKGDAAKATEAAQAYREQVVLEAQGDVARFDQLDEQYRRAPGVTRERLYLETMQRVLARSNKVIVDAKGGATPIILPPDVFRARPSPAAPADADNVPTAQAPPPLAQAPAEAPSQPQGAGQ